MASLRDTSDPEHGGRYTVKLYDSEKAPHADGEWRHATVTLRPDSDDARFAPMVFTEAAEGAVNVVAEFVRVL